MARCDGSLLAALPASGVRTTTKSLFFFPNFLLFNLLPSVARFRHPRAVLESSTQKQERKGNNGIQSSIRRDLYNLCCV